MISRRHPRRTRTLLPVIVLLLLGTMAFVLWLAYTATHPPTRPYLVTPERFSSLSEQGLRATEETWQNRDGTTARGWLLRGTEGAPAVVMLHAFERDRSSFLNLGVKLNEATNFTVLWTDARGHGENPVGGASAFGAREGTDVIDALNYLRTLKARDDMPLISGDVGIYGVEMGAYAALAAATQDPAVRALVLDSIITQPDELLRLAVLRRTSLDSSIINSLARLGTHLYFLGSYDNTPACTLASRLTGDTRVMLLSGADAGALRDATAQLAGCLPAQARVELNAEIPVTGLSVISATGVESEAYDRRVIDFFERMLRDE